MNDINKIADYIIHRLKCEQDIALNNIKLQKLLYYSQSWSLAINDRPLFNEEFEAWVHGPVSKVIFTRFVNSKWLYSDITVSDIMSKDFKDITEEDKKLIDMVLETYSTFTGTELEYLSHQEDPWLKTREGLRPTESSSKIIDKELMKSFYRTRLTD